MVTDLLQAEQWTSSHPLLSSKKHAHNSNSLVGMEESKPKINFSGRFETDTSQVCEQEEKCLYLKTLTQCKTQIEIWYSKVSLLALLSFPAWETHLQDTPHSPLVLIHTDNASFLLFLHSYFTGTNSKGFSAAAKNANICKDTCGYLYGIRYNITAVLGYAAEFYAVTQKNMFKTCLLRLN